MDINTIRVGDTIRGITKGSGDLIYHDEYVCKIIDMKHKDKNIEVMIVDCKSVEKKRYIGKYYTITKHMYDKFELSDNRTELSKLINSIYIVEKEKV